MLPKPTPLGIKQIKHMQLVKMGAMNFWPNLLQVTTVVPDPAA